MSYVVNNLIALYHPPKTGSQWCKLALRAVRAKVEPITIGPDVTVDHATPWHGLTKKPIGVTIRHPLSWYESHWRYQMQKKWRKWEQGKWHPLRAIESCEADTFGVFMANILVQQPGFYSRMLEWYVGPDNHNVKVFRQENLAEELGNFLDIKLDGIDRVNESEKRCVEWVPGIRKRVLELERHTIERFYDGKEAV